MLWVQVSDTACESLAAWPAHPRLLKLARSIADLEGSEKIRTPRVPEALHAAAQAEIDDRAILFSWRRLGGLPPAGAFPAKYAGTFGGQVSGA
jgi:hypothetical protein